MKRFALLAICLIPPFGTKVRKSVTVSHVRSVAEPGMAIGGTCKPTAAIDGVEQMFFSEEWAPRHNQEIWGIGPSGMYEAIVPPPRRARALR
jgi:hypothetical protein